MNVLPHTVLVLLEEGLDIIQLTLKIQAGAGDRCVRIVSQCNYWSPQWWEFNFLCRSL